MARPRGMAGFTVVWAGQVVSMLGTAMAQFGLMFWVWNATHSATPMAILAFCQFFPAIIMTPIAGSLVDRWDRKRTMMISDLVAGSGSVMALLLFSSGSLAIWQLYAIGIFTGMFGAFQWPAYSAAISTMVEKKHYARADGMMGMAEAVSGIAGAPIAAFLLIAFGNDAGLQWILVADILTFTFAIGMLLLVHIPQPPPAKDLQEGRAGVFKDALYGFRYIWARKPLLYLQLSFLVVNFLAGPAMVLLNPMILAKTGSDKAVLGTVQAFFGVGGLIGSIALAAWGGPKRKILALLVGDFIAGMCICIGFGIGRNVYVWAASAFLVMLTLPISNGASQAIWQSKVEPNRQGRVFAARRLIAQFSSAVTMVISGPLADQFFEPGMQANGTLAGTFGWLVGTGPGAGMALFLVFSGLAAALAVPIFYLMPKVRNVERLVPDWKEEKNPPENAANQ
ncbi:MAG: MFS transporter [Euryarchaeota archaeon]|nr:MFS transporter [Euryarchaeota archaeon]